MLQVFNNTQIDELNSKKLTQILSMNFGTRSELKMILDPYFFQHTKINLAGS